jgi:beta-galactosidase
MAMRKLLSGEYIPFGTQYYRAPSPPPSEWERDLARIAGLGLNTVKFWAQWRWNNPSEGSYLFDDIDRLMDLAQANGLRVMLNTIVDVAPAWVYRKFPDASMRTLDGRSVGPQTQPHRQIGGLGVCFNHPGVMEHLFTFLKTTIRRYSGHPALEIWNVASEPELTSSMAEMRLYAEDARNIRDMLCYCDNCRAAFRTFLSAKYGTIGALNTSWNRNYASFDDAEVPLTRNTFNDMIDWRMFFVHTLGEHVRRRFEVARSEDRGRHGLMCHHVFIQGFPLTSTANDPWNVGQYGDLHGITQMDDPMMSDVLRSCAKGRPVISAEMLMLFGYTLELPVPVTANDVKRYVFTGVAANLKGFIFWQYRPETLGREAPAWGLTFPDGTASPWLGAWADVNRVLQKHATFLLDASPRKARIAILYAPENQVFGWASTGSERNVTESLLGMHGALYSRNFLIDFVHPGEIASGILREYRVVIVPFPYCLSSRICSALEEWVSSGGLLIGESYFGGWDVEHGRHHTTVPGYGMDRVFGARQGVVGPAEPDGSIDIVVTADLPHCTKGTHCRGAIVRESLIPSGAHVLATFADGEPAVTRGTYGKGEAVLIGSYLALPYYRSGHSPNADLIAGLVEERAGGATPVVRGNGKVRVDLLAAPSGKRMIILQNLEKVNFEGTVHIPEIPLGDMDEQFGGGRARWIAEGDGASAEVSLGPREVKVYCG